MKTKIITATTLALLAASNVQNTVAHDYHDHGWSTAGKVLTGVAAASIIAQAVAPRPTVVYAGSPTTVVYQTVPTTTTAVVSSQPVATTATVPVASIPDASTVPNAPVIGAQPAQQVVVQQQPTVVYQQPAVVYAPAPVIYAPAPVYYPPVGFSFVFGSGYHHGGYYHGYHGYHGGYHRH